MKGYDTDSDSECDVGFHRRKNRNPKAFYQQMKKNNKTLSIKAMKKRAKEGKEWIKKCFLFHSK